MVSIGRVIWSGSTVAHLEGCLGLEDLGEGFACLDPEGVAIELDLLYRIVVSERGDVLLDIGRGVELVGLASQTEDLGHTFRAVRYALRFR